MEPRSNEQSDELATGSRLVAPVGAGVATAIAAGVMAVLGAPAVGAALAGGLCGGLVGGWVGVSLGRGKAAEAGTSYSVVTHERPGWRTVDLREDRRVRP